MAFGDVVDFFSFDGLGFSGSPCAYPRWFLLFCFLFFFFLPTSFFFCEKLPFLSNVVVGVGVGGVSSADAIRFFSYNYCFLSDFVQLDSDFNHITNKYQQKKKQ